VIDILAQSHDHTVSVPVVLGPLILRVGLLTAVIVVAAFALLRVFLPEQDRATTMSVAIAAACGVVLDLMLADKLAMPSQAVVLLLATLAVPITLIRQQDRSSAFADRVRRFAPVPVALAGTAAYVQLGHGWLGDRPADGLLTVLHTGVVLALAGLAWLTICRPRSLTARVLVRVEAATLAIAVVAGTAFAMVLPPPPGALGASAISQPAVREVHGVSHGGQGDHVP
jgi:hypothetical protein